MTQLKFSPGLILWRRVLDTKGQKGHFEKALSNYKKAQITNRENPLYGAKVAAILLYKQRYSEFNQACIKMKEERRDINEEIPSINEQTGKEIPDAKDQFLRSVKIHHKGERVALSEILNDTMMAAKSLRANKFHEFNDTINQLRQKVSETHIASGI
eukprot:Protomagalhaensia_wolfi_Nauph_80__6196@NODE_920_length_1884_cov_6_009214_g692_i0_p1_GENE_NODE_920_length_1884_cov_6_009214_g692_i0NODE_920_length_1884_cov_6_009214_g692_i0_p1_ORF_typecomplete_len157_score29_89SNAP/PF14938_6/0_39SNAP/PF14938_6/1e02Taxilin/PF09728_9/0_63Taxilin/PF09728_9/25TPR_7/PF13176_6/0_14Macoilin/PF09726_9/0_2GAT/PF03127_14/48GAT/PF03127_14/8_1DUF3583/PF12126_8/2e03DUF3583/PF12126_8/0_7DUF3583/PF12126_8/1_4e02_NODE_920_length_1884_cov_6_009214_g692_i0297767